MILYIRMKSPNGVRETVDLVLDWKVPIDETHDEWVEAKRQEGYKVLEKWFRHNEYVTLEVDTDKGTCVVLPNK
jgi:hypothetical protein